MWIVELFVGGGAGLIFHLWVESFGQGACCIWVTLDYSHPIVPLIAVGSFGVNPH